MRVRTPVALLRSLSDKYPRERYETPYLPRYWLNSIIAVLLEGWLWHWITHEGWYAIKQRNQTIKIRLSIIPKTASSIFTCELFFLLLCVVSTVSFDSLSLSLSLHQSLKDLQTTCSVRTGLVISFITYIVHSLYSFITCVDTRFTKARTAFDHMEIRPDR